MAFREKSAWVSLVCMVVFGALWTGNLVREGVYGLHVGSPFAVFVAQVTILIVMEVVLHIAIAMHSPRDARTPKDEREQLIDLKASRIAFYVLLAGAFLSLATLHVPGANRLTLVHSLMGAIITTMLVRFGAQIALYRRDA